MWRSKIKEQVPQLTLLYHGKTLRSSQQRCYIRKLFLKFCTVHRKHLCWSLFSKKLQVLFQICNFMKKRPQHRCFPVYIANFLILPILKNICKQLRLNFFNGSLLHGPKGLTSKLYDSVRFQGLSDRSSFCFKSASLVLKQVPTCIPNPKTNMSDRSIKFLH